MYPEDRVLVGVINRKRDLVFARDEGWYRIPQQQMTRGLHAKYIAFFLSRAFGEQNGGIHYFAEQSGYELAYRRDLLPAETDHKHADWVYYRIALKDFTAKLPPVLNPTRRRFAFIYTTWDRFVGAQRIGDLYSQDDYFVDRIYHALRNRGVQAVERIWGAEGYDLGVAPQVRVLCENGSVIASTEKSEGVIYMDAARYGLGEGRSQQEDTILAAMLAEMERRGGPAFVNIPLEGI